MQKLRNEAARHDSTEVTIEAPCIEKILGLVGHHCLDLDVSSQCGMPS
jgi:hypothetical protein